MNMLTRILKGLTGVTEDKPPKHYQQQVLLTGLYEPPTYFVYILMRMAEFTDYHYHDKSRWEFYVQYKNIPFCIRDFKMSTWSIDALDESIDTEYAKNVADELKMSIVKTGRNLDKLLKPMLQDFINKGNYFLPNSYRHLRNLYDYFRRQVEETQDKLHQLNIGGKSQFNEETQSDLLNYISSHIRQEIELEKIVSYNACAMVSFFFSYIEFLMDIVFIFYPLQNLEFHKYQEQSWRERFTAVFPMDKDANLKKIYRKLLEIRNEWRNVIEHGFRNKEESILIPYPGLGLIPISYVSALKAIHFAQTPSPVNGVQEALDTFSSFDTWAANNQQTLYAVLYAQSGFPIPREEQRLQEIRGWMSSPKTFEQALEAESAAEQDFWDQYQY